MDIRLAFIIKHISQTFGVLFFSIFVNGKAAASTVFMWQNMLCGGEYATLFGQCAKI